MRWELELALGAGTERVAGKLPPNPLAIRELASNAYSRGLGGEPENTHFVM